MPLDMTAKRMRCKVQGKMGGERAPMGWFGPKLPIDADELEWQFACFKWLLEEFEGIERHRETPLASPTVHHFPPSYLTGHARALELFEQVQTIAGFGDIVFEIEAGDADRPYRAASGLGIVHTSHTPLGTYRVEDRGAGTYQPIITYNPALIGEPARLVATFAHEIAHYLLDGARRNLPGGREMHELATDIGAVFLGFGIFLANGVKNFTGFQDHDQMGWSSTRSGYVSEAGLVTALAIAERLAGRDPLVACAWLKPHLAADLKRADGWLAKHRPDLLTTVMAIDLTDYGVN